MCRFVKIKNRWDWRNTFDCHIFNMLCRYSTWEFELYTTDYNTNKSSYQKANIGVWCSVLVASAVKSVENRHLSRVKRDRKQTFYASLKVCFPTLSDLLVTKRILFSPKKPFFSAKKTFFLCWGTNICCGPNICWGPKNYCGSNICWGPKYLLLKKKSSLQTLYVYGLATLHFLADFPVALPEPYMVLSF